MSRRGRSQVSEVSPGTDVGGYEVEARLEAGGFGTVFRARKGPQRYALKLLHLEEVGRWGRREVALLARLDHPHVVRFRACYEWPDEAPRYLVVVMEYVEGRRLDVWARQENPSARQVVLRCLEVARALAAAHRAGVVHGDVKEANVLVREAQGGAVLVDFGAGGFVGVPRWTGGVLPPCTPHYRSPEAWRFLRERAGQASARYSLTPGDDLYALGVVLYWLLTDGLPFEGGDEAELMEAVLTGSPVPPHVRNPRVPRALGEMCLRLLEKRPEARYPDALALCQALEELRARADAAWDEPLCEAFSAHNITTRPGPEVDEVGLWLKEVKEAEARPRRGWRPPAPSAPALALAGASSPVLPGAHPPVSGALARRAAWLVLLAFLGIGGMQLLGRELRTGVTAKAGRVEAHAPTISTLPARSQVGSLPMESGSVWEVAPPWRQLEAGKGAAFWRPGAPSSAPRGLSSRVPRGHGRARQRRG